MFDQSARVCPRKILNYKTVEVLVIIGAMKKLYITLLLLTCHLAMAHKHHEKEESYTYDPFFLDVMTSQNTNEIKLLKLAERASRVQKIKQFAIKSVSLLQKENLTMKKWRAGRYPKAPLISSPDIHLASLSKLKGKEFDTKFLLLLTDELNKSLELSKRASLENFETDIKAFALKLQNLQVHRQKNAQDLLKEIK